MKQTLVTVHKKKWGEFSPGLTLSPSNKKYLTKAHYPLEERN